jgi:hypothetical protein
LAELSLPHAETDDGITNMAEMGGAKQSANCGSIYKMSLLTTILIPLSVSSKLHDNRGGEEGNKGNKGNTA